MSGQTSNKTNQQKYSIHFEILKKKFLNVQLETEVSCLSVLQETAMTTLLLSHKLRDANLWPTQNTKMQSFKPLNSSFES